MKKILFFALILVSVQAWSQAGFITHDSLNTNVSTGGLLSIASNGTATGTAISLPTPTLSRLLISIESKTVIMVTNSGDLYYRPATFCQCDSCKKRTDLIYLRNIYIK